MANLVSSSTRSCATPFCEARSSRHHSEDLCSGESRTVVLPGARCCTAVSLPATKPCTAPRMLPASSEIGTTTSTLPRSARVIAVIENAPGESIRNAKDEAKPQNVAGTLLSHSKREASTIKNDAIPAAIADETEARRCSQSPATLIATSHAITTPKTMDAELLTNALRLAPDWSELAQPMNAAQISKLGKVAKDQTEAAAISAAASAPAWRGFMRCYSASAGMVMPG